MLKLENQAVLKNEKLRTLRAILMQPQTIYKSDLTGRFHQNLFKRNVQFMAIKWKRKIQIQWEI